VEERGATAYVAEFVGTFLLVLFIGLVLASNSEAGLGFADFAVIGLLHAFVLMMLVATLGGTSGAHFNPAVTVTLAAVRQIAWADAAVYIVVQLLGAVAAALVVDLMVGTPADVTNFGAAALNDRFVTSDAAGFLAEAVGTFALMWAIMGVAVNPRADREWAPLVIGGTLGFVVFTIGPLTGASVNPARAFGPALVGDAFGGAGTFLFAYVAGPLVGAVLAGIAYTALVIAPRGLPMERPVDHLERSPTDAVAEEAAALDLDRDPDVERPPGGP
jgi:glycerol uptake facilitator protein